MCMYYIYKVYIYYIYICLQSLLSPPWGGRVIDALSSTPPNLLNQPQTLNLNAVQYWSMDSR